MKAKGKIILSSIALVLVVTLAIVAVFALTQTSTSSSFKVNFIGTRNVKATIKAKSKLSNSDTIIETPTNVTFDGSSSDTATKTINFATEITIPSTDVTADYIFEIYNNITDDSAAELIVEPSVEENGLTNATITTYYQTNTANEYSQFTGTYTYATLAKDQAIRFKVSVKINDGVTTDVTIKDAKISFKLYTHTTAPSGYESNALSVTTSNLLSVGDKVSYGEYPQTYVGDTLNATLKAASSTELVETGNTYTVYMNSETATTVKEYSHNGEKYAKVESAVFGNPSKTTFTSGEALAGGGTYFFKVEPITFTVMEINNGRATVYADKTLCAKRFNSINTFTATYSSRWETSELRSYMNGTFATDSGLANIALDSTVKNNTDSDEIDGSGASTTDKLYAASATEVSTWYSTNEEMISKSTDFAMATGVYTGTGDYNNNAWWLLRSATANVGDIYGVLSASGINPVSVDSTNYGLRCAMQIAV